MEYIIRVQDTPESRKLIEQLMKMNRATVVNRKHGSKARFSRPRDLSPFFNDQGRALDQKHHVSVADAAIDSVDISLGDSLHGN